MNQNFLRIILAILFFAYLASFIYNRFFDPNPGLLRNSEEFLDENGEIPEELGQVAWMRDYTRAISLSRTHDRPIILYFEEIPGSGEAKMHGSSLLSDPFICELIESSYIPVVVFRNGNSKDKQLMDLLGEGREGEGTFRFTDHKAKEIKNRVFLSSGIRAVLEELITAREGNKVDEYLHIYIEQARSENESLKNRSTQVKELQFLPISSFQAERISELIEMNKDYKHLLSPRQIAMQKIISQHPEVDWELVADRDFSEAWWAMVEKAEKNKLF